MHENTYIRTYVPIAYGFHLFSQIYYSNEFFTSYVCTCSDMYVCVPMYVQQLATNTFLTVKDILLIFTALFQNEPQSEKHVPHPHKECLLEDRLCIPCCVNRYNERKTHSSMRIRAGVYRGGNICICSYAKSCVNL